MPLFPTVAEAGKALCERASAFARSRGTNLGTDEPAVFLLNSISTFTGSVNAELERLRGEIKELTSRQA